MKTRSPLKIPGRRQIFWDPSPIWIFSRRNWSPQPRSLISGRFQVGLSLPLWFVPHQGRSQAAEYSKQAAQANYQNEKLLLEGQLQQAAQQYAKSKSSLNYYRESALPNADLILKQVQTALRSGNIGYAEYLLGVRNAISIKEGFLQTLNDYNQSIIYIEFLAGNRQ